MAQVNSVNHGKCIHLIMVLFSYQLCNNSEYLNSKSYDRHQHRNSPTNIATWPTLLLYTKQRHRKSWKIKTLLTEWTNTLTIRILGFVQKTNPQPTALHFCLWHHGSPQQQITASHHHQSSRAMSVEPFEATEKVLLKNHHKVTPPSHQSKLLIKPLNYGLISYNYLDW